MHIMHFSVLGNQTIFIHFEWVICNIRLQYNWKDCEVSKYLDFNRKENLRLSPNLNALE